jgi:hypothetical protein
LLQQFAKLVGVMFSMQPTNCETRIHVVTQTLEMCSMQSAKAHRTKLVLGEQLGGPIFHDVVQNSLPLQP